MKRHTIDCVTAVCKNAETSIEVFSVTLNVWASTGSKISEISSCILTEWIPLRSICFFLLNDWSKLQGIPICCLTLKMFTVFRSRKGWKWTLGPQKGFLVGNVRKAIASSHHHCLSGSTLAGNWSQESELRSKFKYWHREGGCVYSFNTLIFRLRTIWLGYHDQGEPESHLENVKHSLVS